MTAELARVKLQLDRYTVPRQISHCTRVMAMQAGGRLSAPWATGFGLDGSDYHGDRVQF